MRTTPASAPQTTSPSPAGATDEETFVAELRRLKTWSGMSFRELERRATAAGDTLPASTTATMLGRNRLPREALLVSFTRACGLDVDEMRPWLAARAAIADGTGARAAQVAPAVSPRRDAASRWRPTVVAAAALVITFVGGAAVPAAFEGHSSEEQETVVLAP